MFDIPITLLKFYCKPIKKFGVRRFFSLHAKVFGCLNDSGSKELLPKSIDDHPRGKGVFLGYKPLRQIEPVDCISLANLRKHCRHSNTNFGHGLFVITNVKDESFTGFGEFLHNHNQREGFCKIIPFINRFDKVIENLKEFWFGFFNCLCKLLKLRLASRARRLGKNLFRFLGIVLCSIRV